MLSLRKLSQTKHLIFIFFLITTVFLLRNILGPDIQTINLENNKVQTRCLSQPIENIKNNNYEEYKIEKIPQDLYISENIKNLYCYGFVGNIEISEEEKVITTFYNSSLKIFSLFNNLINFLLILSIFLKVKFSRHVILISFYIFNYLNFDLFIPVVSKSFVFLPFLEINYFDISLFTNLLFISLFLSRSTNNKIFLIGFMFHLLLLVDFLPIFIISKILQNKFIFNFNNFERKVFIALPVAYYIVKIISSLTSRLDFFWLNTSKSGFRGLTRYPDLQQVFFNLSCQKGKVFNLYNVEGNLYSCDEFTKGSFNFSLFTNFSDANIVLSAIIVFNLFLIFWIFIYFKMLNILELDKNFVVILSVSTPFIYLISQGNDDFLGLVISIFCLYDLRKFTFLKLLILTVTSFLIIHSGFLLFAIMLLSLFIKDQKVAIKTSIFNLIFAIFILYNLFFNSISILNNNSYQYVFPDMGFGIMLDTEYLSFISGADQFVVLIFLLFTLLIIFKSNFIKIFYLGININAIKSVIFKKEYLYFLSIIIYFVFMFIFPNISYRLPAFFIFFILLLTYSKTNVRILFLLFLLLEPLIKSSPKYFSNFTTMLSTVSGYIVLCVALKLLFDLIKGYKYYVES